MAKILHVCGLDSFVGAIQPLLERLSEQDHEVHCACTDTGQFTEWKERGFVMFDIPVIRKIHAPSNLLTIYKLFRLMLREEYDIVHVHNPIASVLGRIAAKLAGVRHIIYTSHGFYFHQHSTRLQYNLFYYLEKSLARLCTNHLFLVSREDYELSLDRHFKKPERIHHVGNGVDVWRRFNPGRIDPFRTESLRRQLGIGNEDMVVVFIGRLVKEKGIVELMEAYQILKKYHPRVKLLLAGEVHSSERDQSVLHHISGFSNGEIMELGYRKDIPEILSLSDIFVMPSYREGLPLSILEAMAMEKSIVATNIRGCREEVVDGLNGYLVNIRDSQALFSRIDSLLRNKETRLQFGQDSRLLAVERFDIEKTVKLQTDIYDRILLDESPRLAINPPTYHS